MDQGERYFRFWLNAGPLKERREAIDREALVHNEKPYALSFFPSGEGNRPSNLAELSDNIVQMTVFKKAERSQHFIIRLFEPTGVGRTTFLTIPCAKLKQEVYLQPFEIKTLKLDMENGNIEETDLME